MELTTETDGAYTYFRLGPLLKGMVQTEPSQAGDHYVRLFTPDAYPAAAATFADGVALVRKHAGLTGGN
jgi:hypothetical protein